MNRSCIFTAAGLVAAMVSFALAYTDPNTYSNPIPVGTHLTFADNGGQTVDLFAASGGRLSLWPGTASTFDITVGESYGGQVLVGYTYSQTAHGEDFNSALVVNTVAIETDSGTYTYQRTVSTHGFWNESGVGTKLFGIYIPASRALVFAGDSRAILTFPDGTTSSNATGFFRVDGVQASRILMSGLWSGCAMYYEAVQPQFFMMASSPQIAPVLPSGSLDTNAKLIPVSPTGTIVLNWRVW